MFVYPVPIRGVTLARSPRKRGISPQNRENEHVIIGNLSYDYQSYDNLILPKFRGIAEFGFENRGKIVILPLVPIGWSEQRKQHEVWPGLEDFFVKVQELLHYSRVLRPRLLCAALSWIVPGNSPLRHRERNGALGNSGNILGHIIWLKKRLNKN